MFFQSRDSRSADAPHPAKPTAMEALRLFESLEDSRGVSAAIFALARAAMLCGDTMNVLATRIAH
jgi:hypothetical protein